MTKEVGAARQRGVPLIYGGVFGTAGTAVASNPLDTGPGGGGAGGAGGHVVHAGFLWQQLQPTAKRAALRISPANVRRSIIWLSPLLSRGRVA